MNIPNVVKTVVQWYNQPALSQPELGFFILHSSLGSSSRSSISAVLIVRSMSLK